MPTSTSTFHAPARVPSRVAPAPAAVARPTVAPAPAVARVALVGNHVPRRCGIATFTADLTDALAAARPQLECFVVAMDEPGGGHAYPPRVSGTIVADQLSQYQAAAAAVNASGADVVSLQHEYGIYGGPAGAHVLTLVRALRVPVVTTLHTILAAPNPAQRAVMDELTRRSQRLVVMSARGAELLRALHDVPAAKIDLIPHGIPDFPATAPAAPASLLTFGLLARDKGLEYVIDAMPAILRRHPGATYVIVGATHPHVRAHDGEAYRDMLRARAAAAGVAGNVIFHDRFVDKAELAAFLGAATIYVTPYLKPEQITSGTLAFAVGAGKAVISTPYVYAEELLAEGRGLLVPARDPAAIAAAVIGLLDDPAACQAMSARAATYGRAMAWPQVARAYLDSFAHARADHATRATTRPPTRATLPPLALGHVDRLTDDTGILQHALVTVPRYADGYCLDDNARALLLSARLEQLGAADLAATRSRAGRYLAFVNHALTDDGRFRNFMDYQRAWTEPHGSDDSHGRALWALGAIAGHSGEAGHRHVADQLLRAGLPAVAAMASPRAWAYALLGIDAARAAAGDAHELIAVRTIVAARLLGLYRRTATAEWPWFEDRLTYCNPRLCEALIVTGQAAADPAMTATGVDALTWLAGVQADGDGTFAPIGSDGFYPRDGARAGFDQQPVEAHAMVSACLAAAAATGDAGWTDRAFRAFGWFLGDNQLGRPLYDATTGGCRDGLHVDRVNQNQGAESTLSCQLALAELRLATRAIAGTA
ncbi:MAG: glycosyltransferase family 4 protein [Myxococcales bacterium]|nr:glycosyltransferase family 4 protein [Myxococcales bacterium]MBK7197842.1 glycosyltransferase family 4 protein [Myxococcales bacterium]MBP6846312.1 glycosyltransferase family 4 protein [Kofleriaceae bacterium]